MDRAIRNLAYRMRSSALLALIGVNVAIWLLLRIAALVVWLSTGGAGAERMVTMWVELPAAPSEWPLHFYGLATYMFAQYDILHLAFNMLWLYWFGRMYLEISSERSLVVLYLYGGLAGGLLFVCAYNLLPPLIGQSAWLIGSSASVLAIVTATAVLMPDYPVQLILLGEVKIKWIAIVSIVLVLVSFGGGNTGGEIAHAGGIAMGAAVALLRRRGRDITKWPRRTPRSAGRPVRQADSERGNGGNDTAELDALLDKVRRSGYGSLSDKEKRRLLEISNKMH